MGVSAMEMYGARVGKSFLAITDQEGQQEVAIKGCFSGTFSHKVVGFFYGTQVCADGHFHHIVKAEHLHGGLYLFRRQFGAELVDKRRRYDGNDAVSAVDGMDKLEDLAFVRNGAKGTVYQAHATGYALVVIDLGTAVFIRADGVHAAGFGAGPLHFQNGAVGAHGSLQRPHLMHFVLVDLRICR